MGKDFGGLLMDEIRLFLIGLIRIGVEDEGWHTLKVEKFPRMATTCSPERHGENPPLTASAMSWPFTLLDQSPS